MLKRCFHDDDFWHIADTTGPVLSGMLYFQAIPWFENFDVGYGFNIRFACITINAAGLLPPPVTVVSFGEGGTQVQSPIIYFACQINVVDVSINGQQ